MSEDVVSYPPLAETMGIVEIEASPERAVTRMPVAPNRQPFGLLAGGASAMLAESTASRAAILHAARYGRITVGAELNASHHASVRDGYVTATATAVHLGRATASFEVVITEESGKRVCTARVLCLIVDRPHR